ncbi:hypothetical protein P7C71_g237, partial [Lecanoromycetidae sp. Uapishka_2]
MFRRLSSSLPKDPEFPADLEKLGYHINEHDQIRSLAHPDQEFNFFISKNERVRETQREAMDTCIRRELNTRFQAASLTTIRLPLNAGLTDPHVPILASSNLSTAKRIIVYIGESVQDLGVLAYRIIGQESITAGSVLNFVNEVHSRDGNGDTAIVIANMGQLLWHRRTRRAMTMASWNGQPRKTGVSNAVRIDPVKNHIPGNMNVEEHVKSIFEEVILESAREDVAINLVAIGDGAEDAVKYLDRNWARWEKNVRAICVGLGFIWRVGEDVQDEKFMDFWGKRGRAYLIHNEDVDTPLHGRQEVGCNCFSSGEPTFTECIMPRAYKNMLAYFQLVNDVPGYFEVESFVPEGDDGSRFVNWKEGIRAESPRAA